MKDPIDDLPAQMALCDVANASPTMAVLQNVLDVPSGGLPEKLAALPEHHPNKQLALNSWAAWGDRYFETQEAAMCGQHALNNMLGVKRYDADLLEQACQTVIAETGEHAAFHRRLGGWYSHAVLARALDYTIPPVWRMLDRPACHEDWCLVATQDEVAGVVCNVNNKHWTCICRQQGRVFYVDSVAFPHIIQESDFIEIINRHPMTFLVVHNTSDIK